MKTKQLFTTLLFFLGSLAISAQRFSDLEKEVNLNNKSGKFEKSIVTITDFVEAANISPYEKYQAYILKADTHKALFDYDNTLKSLDLALKAGLESDKKDEVSANIKAEKAFAYFDIQKYKESDVLMKELNAANYKFLDVGTTSYIIMQEGYLDFLNENYTASEEKYDEAISFMKKVGEANLPVIYGKKILLYSKMRDGKKALEAFNQGKEIALNPKKLKYLLYLNESLRTFYEENNQWELAEKTFHRVDSLRSMYNSEESVNRISLLEKDLEIQTKDSEVRQAKLLRNSLLVICIALIFGIFLAFRLHKSNKARAFLLEKENIRIRDDLQLLTSSLNSQGFTKMDLSHFNLSERQLEIIELVRIGKSNKEIANAVFISENTVKYHLKSIYEILDIENRSDFFKLIRN